MQKDREDIQSSPNKLEEYKYGLTGRSAAEGVKGQEHMMCERSLKKQASFSLEKSGLRGSALLFNPVWSSNFQYHREDKSRLFTAIHRQLGNIAAWGMTDCHKERSIYSENSYTPEKEVQIGLESPFVDISNLNHYVNLCESMFFMNRFSPPIRNKYLIKL